jgi:hypothetical protein
MPKKKVNNIYVSVSLREEAKNQLEENISIR